jgi:hypothetical protein
MQIWGDHLVIASRSVEPLTLAKLVASAEFWAALAGAFSGAIAAFVLGALGTWWTASNAKRTAGNLTLITLGQMYGLMENLRHHYLVSEPKRAGDVRKLVGYKPLSYELRPLLRPPEQRIRVPIDSLGFLADSHDPDVLNRLLAVERAFHAMVDLVERHGRLHQEFAAGLNKDDPSGQKAYLPTDLIPIVGAKLLIEIDDAVHEFTIGLPRCCADLLAIGQQLRQTLRMQFPIRRFVGLVPVPRAGIASLPTNLPMPSMWRRVTRRVADLLRGPYWRARPEPMDSEATPETEAAEIRRFPPRSYDC